MAEIKKQRKGTYLLESNGMQETFKFDDDVADFLKRNAKKIRYHSGEKVQNWLYKNATGKETSLAKKIYVDFKRYNTLDRIMGKVTFHNENNRDLRRENLTVKR